MRGEIKKKDETSGKSKNKGGEKKSNTLFLIQTTFVRKRDGDLLYGDLLYAIFSIRVARLQSTTIFHFGEKFGKREFYLPFRH